jgi:hypothetical protein
VSWYAMSDTKKVVSLLQHQRNRVTFAVTMGVKGGGVVTPLSVVRLCGRGVLPRGPCLLSINRDQYMSTQHIEY